MKVVTKWLMALAFVIFLGTAMPLEVQAATSGDWEYEIDEDKTHAVITDYTGADSAVTVPSKLGGKPVWEIGDSAFSENKYIVTVKIPTSVWKIGNSAFYKCESLKSITGATKISCIDDLAFFQCEKLKNYPFNEKITDIGANAFNKTALTEISLKNVASIGAGAFAYCNGLTTVTIPNGCYVDNAAFVSCEGLTKVKLGVIESYDFGSTTQYHGMFEYCTNLVAVEIANGNKAIYSSMFKDCKSLTAVNIPSSVRVIGSNSFWGCESLANIKIPYGVVEMREGAFANTAITTLLVPNSVVRLEFESAIHYGVGEYNMHTIRIPHSVTEFGTCYFATNKEKTIECYANSSAADYFANNSCSLKYLTEVPSTSLTVDRAKLTMAEGEMVAIKYSVAPSNTSDAVVWESTNTSVAEVNGVGEILAKSSGNTTIVATTTSGIRKQIKVTVKETTIKAPATYQALVKGDTASCKATVIAGGTKRKDLKATYKSSNLNVATVTAAGKIKAVGVGTATITITCLGETYTCQVQVVNKLTKPTVLSLQNAGSKKLTLRWNSVLAAEGYQIQYSTSPKFKNAKSIKVKAAATYVGSNEHAKMLSKLKKNTKYYVRVRAYSKVGKQIKYSPWSKKLSCKTN